MGGNINFELKENQILNTGIKNCLFGWAVNVDRQSKKEDLFEHLEKARCEMIIKHPRKYP